jgi:predicted metal-binding protein
MKKIGIIICDRWRRCAGGKCLRALHNREGAFERYRDEEIELVGYTTCDGCPGGNVEYAPAEMKRNGVEVVHLATGLLVGYPPCPFIEDFRSFIEKKYGLKVVLGTHPVPQNYFETHQSLGTWSGPEWSERLEATLVDEPGRRLYD